MLPMNLLAFIAKAIYSEAILRQNVKCILNKKERYYYGDVRSKREVPRDVRNTKVRRQDKFRRYW